MREQCKALYVSHGGGPMPLLGDPDHQEMVDCLRQIAEQIPRPEALIVVSAHWESPVPSVTAVESPGLLYDYYGFPEEAYSIRYPCKGSPALAARIQSELGRQGMSVAMETSRGLDHGVFVPLSLMYPQADIPCVQLSLLSSLDPAAHIAMGAALAPILEGNVLLLGSGFSFHNMRAFFSPIPAAYRTANEDFERWLHHTCSDSSLDEQSRAATLRQWAQAPGARFCHPREEHLLPLHVCYGAAQTASKQAYSLKIMNKQSSMYLW